MVKTTWRWGTGSSTSSRSHSAQRRERFFSQEGQNDLLKVAPATISRVLDHTLQGVGQVTHVYAKYDFLEEKRKALDAWGAYLAKLVRERPASSDTRVTTRRGAGAPAA